MANFTRHQRGFTLIEMSIVLVIIGLIVGGILKGQELIESSRQKNFISQIDRYKAGTNTFVDRFNSLPGDFSRITMLENSGILEAGDENGTIGADAATINTTAEVFTNVVTDGSENMEYWNHLYSAGLANGSVVDAAPTCFSGACTSPSPLPAAAFPQSGFTLVYGVHQGSTNAKTANWLIAARFGATALATTSHAIVNAARGFQLDNKYDDGFPGSGSIRTQVDAAPCGTSTAGSQYVTTTETRACMLSIALE